MILNITVDKNKRDEALLNEEKKRQLEREAGFNKSLHDIVSNLEVGYEDKIKHRYERGSSYCDLNFTNKDGCNVWCKVNNSIDFINAEKNKDLWDKLMPSFIQRIFSNGSATIEDIYGSANDISSRLEYDNKSCKAGLYAKSVCFVFFK